MFGKCKHHWEEQSRHYIGPNPSGIKSLGYIRDDEAMRAVFGNYTVIVLCCEHCGDVKQQEIDGDATRMVPQRGNPTTPTRKG